MEQMTKTHWGDHERNTCREGIGESGVKRDDPAEMWDRAGGAGGMDTHTGNKRAQREGEAVETDLTNRESDNLPKMVHKTRNHPELVPKSGFKCYHI